MSPLPDDGSEVNVDQSNLFARFPSDGEFRRLAELDAAARRRPKRPIGELKFNEKNSVVGVQHDCSNAFSQEQGHGPHTTNNYAAVTLPSSYPKKWNRHECELGAQCLELRYEDLIQNPHASAARLFTFLGLGDRTISLPAVHPDSMGKFRHQPRRKLREVLALIEPLQRALGYPISET